MARCLTCGDFFKRTPFSLLECELCAELNDSDTQLELSLLKNKSGRTLPVFYEDRDEDNDSHGL